MEKFVWVPYKFFQKKKEMEKFVWVPYNFFFKKKKEIEKPFLSNPSKEHFRNQKKTRVKNIINKIN
jgi:uncharacterized metal-binding protein